MPPLLLLLILGAAFADMKVWQKDTNFDNPNNWNGGGVVCTNDRKSFPKALRASVFIQKNESLQELLLSDNMVLVFEEGASLTFSSNPQVVPSDGSSSDFSHVATSSSSPSPKQTCSSHGRTLAFTARAAPWFDPASWSVPSDNRSHEFMLDLDTVPCSADKVVFPAKNSFQVDMGQKPLIVGSISVRDQVLDSQQAFDKYWSGQTSSYDFVNKARGNTIGGEPCPSDQDCSCPDRYTEDRKSAVCQYLKQEVLTHNCSNPIQAAYGLCNPVCGAKISLAFNSSSESQVLKVSRDFIRSNVDGVLAIWPGVSFALGPYKDGVMEVILKDGNRGQDASSSICDIRSRMQLNQTSFMFGITDFTFERSDGVDNCDPPPKPPHKTTQQNTFSYLILGVALGVGFICILLVIIGIALYKRRYQSHLKTEMELGDVGNGNRLSSQGFDNPVYDTPLPYDDSFVISYETDNDQLHGFENAMYTPGTEPTDTDDAEKKKPVEDIYTPVVKKSSKKSSSKKKLKQVESTGFDNPVYDIQEKDNTDGMVSVSLDEDDVRLPDGIEHDGAGFVNPIATGLSESMMYGEPEEPKTNGKNGELSNKSSPGIENPLYDQNDGAGGSEKGDVTSEITVHVAESLKKKKKSKKGKKGGKQAAQENGDGDLGFGNPLYEGDGPTDLYQPSSPRPEGDEDDL